MKKNIILALALFFVMTGCDSLEQIPYSSKSSASFYSNPKQYDQAVAACYYTIRQYKLRTNVYYMLTESRSDNTFQYQDYDDGQTCRFEETDALPVLETVWANCYSAISKCNTILGHLEKVDFELSNRDQIEGEVRLMRAMVYFDLVRLFAGVPICKTVPTLSESYTLKRSTMQEVYDFIEEDLKAASNLLPESTVTGRFNKYVAEAYMGKVLVFESGYPLRDNKWSEAKDWLKKVIDSNKYEFFNSFADIFLLKNESGKQAVASFTCKSGVGQGNPYPTRNAPRDIAKSGELGILYGGSANCLHISDDLVNSFEKGDVRLPVSIQQVWRHTNGNLIDNEPYCRKYQDGTVAAASDWDIDFIDLRYDEVLLLYAECLNEIGYSANGEAFNIVNKFRTRAGLNPKTSTDVTSQQAFRLWIENERRWEFVGENIRWFDLVRTDRAVDVMKAFLTPYNYGQNVTKNRYFYSIPLRATNENSNLLIDPGFK